MLIIIPLGAYVISWKSDFNSVDYISLIIVGIITWTLVVAIVFKQLLQLKQKQKANDIYMEYNPILENLLDDVRAKQHDIKNQLNAIYGIAEKSRDNELLEYLDTLIEGYQLSSDETLLNTGNNIISAIIYSKKIKANKNNIELNCNCYTPFPKYPIEDYEFVDILGNLLDNAIESANNYQRDIKKEVYVNLFEENNNTVIEVKNTSLPVGFDTLDKVFEKGYSTKGNNRGFGLYNVNKIVKSYEGNIQISYEQQQICFKILFAS
jgi:two-component system sensor histidine kinase AgrC